MICIWRSYIMFDQRPCADARTVMAEAMDALATSWNVTAVLLSEIVLNPITSLLSALNETAGNVPAKNAVGNVQTMSALRNKLP